MGRLRLRLGEGMGGSVLVATPDSVHSTFIEVSFLSLLDRYYSGATESKVKGRLAMRGCVGPYIIRPSGKSISCELWILLVSWHVTLNNL